MGQAVAAGAPGAPTCPRRPKSLYLHSFRQNFALLLLLLRLAALGARPEALPSAEETVAFDLWCKFERGPAQSSWRMRWIGRGARPRRLPAGESTRYPLHHGMATASSTGLSTGAGLHPSSSPPSPGHPWLLPKEGRAELCGGGSASDPREGRRGGHTGKAGKEAWQPQGGGGGSCSAPVKQPLCESPLPGSLGHKAPTAEAGSSSGLAGLD